MSGEKQPGIYFTSDWHVGHANVLVFDQRPFRDLDHMHSVLVNNYNATVGADDTCYFLGDMGLSKTEVVASVVARLQGTRILILGNHDRGRAAMLRAGFDAVMNMAALEVAGSLVTMTHCPLRGVWREDCSSMRGAAEGDNWHGESRHTAYSVPDFGQFHLHGHTHKPPEGRILGRQWDVGVRANNYRPVSLSAVESWVSKSHKPDRRGSK